MKNPYQILGVSKDASAAEIKRQYRKLAAKFHPDVNKSKDAGEKFKEIQSAWEILSDPQKKAQFDQFGTTGGQGGFASGFSGGFDGFDFSGGLGDIFETFFSGGRSGFAGKRGGAQRGRDLRTRLEIDFKQAVTGIEKQIELETFAKCESCDGKGGEKDSPMQDCPTCQGTGQVRKGVQTPFGFAQTTRVCDACQGEGRIFKNPCKSCHGQGRVLRKQKVAIKIPAGVADGMILKVPGKGEAGQRGERAGDLLVEIHVKSSRKFQRENDDIHTTQKIHVLQAILGDEIETETVHGKTKLKIPAGTQSNAVFRIAGQGMPHLGRSSLGDHFLHVEIKIPEKLSAAEKELFQKAAQVANLKGEEKKSFLGRLFG